MKNSVAKKIYSLANPEDVIAFASKLKKFIDKSGLSVKIEKTDYVLVDGWKFAGLNFGLTAMAEKPVALHRPGEQLYVTYALKNGKYWENGIPKWGDVPKIVSITALRDQAEEEKKTEKFIKQVVIPHYKYECDCKIIRIHNREEVATGFALCSNSEFIKSGFDEFAVYSMAQTRAIAKGYRNVIGFVMKAAGFSDTPAEEMDKKDTPEPTKEEIIKTVKENAVLQSSTMELEKYWRSLPAETRQMEECKVFVKELGEKLKKAGKKPETVTLP